MIYLMHPRHGVKIATMELEAQHDEMLGWMRFDPDAVVEDPVEADLPEPAVEVNVLSEAPRRRGRPRAAKDE
jgi:hypothetical protein